MNKFLPSLGVWLRVLSVVIFVLSLPAIVFSQFSVGLNYTAPTCPGYTNGAVYVELTGGWPPYTFSWNTGDTVMNLIGVGAGTYSVTVVDADNAVAIGSIEVQEPPPLVLQVADSDDGDFCNGAVNLAVTASGGSGGPYTFQWSSGGTDAVEATTGPGTYCVTVTDVQGCAEFSCVTLGDPLTVNVTTTNLLCGAQATGTAVANFGGGVGPYSFAWSNGATDQALGGLDAGTYSVTVTDGNGCSAVGSGQVLAPDPLMVVLDVVQPQCGDPLSMGTITANVTGGTLPYTYAWSTGADGNGVDSLFPGTYSVTVTDADGCSVQAFAQVIPLGDIDPGLVVTQPDDCNNPTGSASVSPSGGEAPYSVLWSTGSEDIQVDGLAPGNYSVTVLDNAGCGQVTTFDIQAPVPITVQISSANATCPAAADGSASVEVISGTPPYTYQWSTGHTTAAVNGLAPGTYTVTVTDATGCSTTATAQVGQDSDGFIIYFTTTLVTCGLPNGSATVHVIGGTPPYTYQWDRGDTTPLLDNAAFGYYDVTVTDAAGCSVTGTAFVSKIPKPQLNLSVVDATCGNVDDGMVVAQVINGSPPFMFEWSTGATTPSIDGLAGGIYSVTVTDAIGCVVTGTAEVQQPAPIVCTISEVQSISSCGGSDGSLTVQVVSGGIAPFSYLWSTGETGPTVSGLEHGNYEVTITDATGCTTTCAYALEAPGSIGDRVWIDENNNGCQDDLEQGAAGVTVLLTGTDNMGNAVDLSMVTDGGGLYRFDGLKPGQYQIGVQLPAGMVFTYGNICSDNDLDSDIWSNTGMTSVFSLEANQCRTDVDAGILEDCDNVTDAGTITGDEFLCGPGNDPGPITEVTPPTGGSGNLQYVWMQSHTGGPVGSGVWEVIQGATGPNYDPPLIYQTTWYVRCVRREGCTDYLETNFVLKEVGDEAVAQIEGPLTVCEGDPVLFSALPQAGATYFWDFGPASSPATSTQHSVEVVWSSDGPRTVKLTVTKGGCVSTDALEIMVTNNPVICGSPLVIYGNKGHSKNVQITFQVDDEIMPDVTYFIDHGSDGEEFSTIATLTKEDRKPGGWYEYEDSEPRHGHNFYRVKMVSAQGVVISNVVHIENFIGLEQFLIYPNPVVDLVYLELRGEFTSDSQIIVRSMDEQVVFTDVIPAKTYRYEMNLGALPAGMYFVQIMYNNMQGNQFFKLVKP